MREELNSNLHRPPEAYAGLCLVCKNPESGEFPRCLSALDWDCELHRAGRLLAVSVVAGSGAEHVRVAVLIHFRDTGGFRCLEIGQRRLEMGVSENWGTLFWDPYVKDPTI